MDIVQAVTLGLVQGLTEFLPVSSTAHLTLAPWVFGWQDPGLTFDVALHVGTLVAVAAYFGQDLWQMLVHGLRSLVKRDWSDPYQRLAWLVVIGCVPAIVAGVLLNKYIAGPLRSPLVIAAAMAGVGILMGVAEKLAKHERPLDTLTVKNALLIGLAQACALIPGTSRSGATMTMALFLGFMRPDAARYSFLLGFPVILGSAVFKLKDLAHEPALAAALPMMAVGVVVSAVSGYVCIRFLMNYLQKYTLMPFVAYRVLLGLAIAGAVAAGVPVPQAAD
ncbi:MAG: uppP [Cyanobacteria bacterium RYN_339]|nr:uppP [Cyanobacteria bacterium RYN_339]